MPANAFTSAAGIYGGRSVSGKIVEGGSTGTCHVVKGSLLKVMHWWLDVDVQCIVVEIIRLQQT